MQVAGSSALVTGGASGLGLATAKRLIAAGARVTIMDVPDSAGERVVAQLGEGARFAPADVTDEQCLQGALDVVEQSGPLRIVVHCAGRGGPLRLVDRNGNPGSLELYRAVIEVNLIGTFNVLRLAAARMIHNHPQDGERGVVVLTASVAAFEGQIGQIPYAASKAGVVGMTITAARDLADRLIRVATIAPGTFDTPMVARLSDDVRAALAQAIPYPKRLGDPDEYAALAQHIVENSMLNGETIRLDGAIRMPPR